MWSYLAAPISASNLRMQMKRRRLLRTTRASPPATMTSWRNRHLRNAAGAVITQRKPVPMVAVGCVAPSGVPIVATSMGHRSGEVKIPTSFQSTHRALSHMSLWRNEQSSVLCASDARTRRRRCVRTHAASGAAGLLAHTHAFNTKREDSRRPRLQKRSPPIMWSRTPWTS